MGEVAEPIGARAYRRIIMLMANCEEAEVIVEVGVYGGRLSARFLRISTLTSLTLVDSWLSSQTGKSQAHMDQIAADVIKWGERKDKVTVLHMDSLSAVSSFDDESIDFWHTDGDHSHEGTYRDIVGWLPKVKSGSIMCGDNLEIPTVRTAITQAASELGCEWQEEGKGRIWWFRKP